MDQTGFELPPAPEPPADAPGQGQLFDDDCSQPDAADGEPVFWTGGAGQPFPDDDFVQADLSACIAQAGLSACIAQAGLSACIAQAGAPESV